MGTDQRKQMPADENIAVFGIGSTNFRSALGSPDGTFSTDIRVDRTRFDDLRGQVLDRIDELRDVAGGLDAVSIACAGLIDGETIQEIDTPAGDVVRDVALGPVIEEEFDLPVTVENDCTAAALAEWVFGTGGGYDCVVHVTLGTGIGAGVVDRGHVLRGASGQAAEVGLFSVAPTDRDSCDVPGAWEAYCSGRGITGFVGELLADESRETMLPAPEDLTARDVFEAARAGDAVADDYLDRIGRYNAAGLGGVINAYNPDLITVGGGVGQSNFEVVLERARPHLEAFAYPDLPRIEPTRLGDEIGLYGALAPYAPAEEPDRTPPVEAPETGRAP